MHRVFLQWYWIFPFRFFKVFIIRKIISQEQNKDNGKKSHWAWVSRNAWSTDFHRSLHCVSHLARSRGAYFCSGLPGKVLSSMAKIPWTDRRISRLDVTVLRFLFGLVQATKGKERQVLFCIALQILVKAWRITCHLFNFRQRLLELLELGCDFILFFYNRIDSDCTLRCVIAK